MKENYLKINDGDNSNKRPFYPNLTDFIFPSDSFTVVYAKEGKPLFVFTYSHLSFTAEFVIKNPQFIRNLELDQLDHVFYGLYNNDNFYNVWKSQTELNLDDIKNIRDVKKHLKTWELDEFCEWLLKHPNKKLLTTAFNAVFSISPNDTIDNLTMSFLEVEKTPFCDFASIKLKVSGNEILLFVAEQIDPVFLEHIKSDPEVN